MKVMCERSINNIKRNVLIAINNININDNGVISRNIIIINVWRNV